MRHAFRHLGLVPTTDQRAIKRAYATRLKQTRPEDDPEGFQVLQQSYAQALDWARAQARVEAEAQSEAEAAEAGPAPAALVTGDPSLQRTAYPLPAEPATPEREPALPLVTIHDQPAPIWLPPVWNLPPEPAPLSAPPVQTIADAPPVVAPEQDPVVIAGPERPPSGRPPVLIAEDQRPPPARPLHQSAPPARAARRAPMPGVDLAALAAQVCEHAFHPGLVDWLEAHPHLLDLSLRGRLGELLAAQLELLDTLPEPAQMAALAEFFGWEPLNASLLVRRLLARAAVQAQLDDEAAQSFAYQDEQRQRRDQARLLRQPYVARSHYRHALFPSQVRRMHARLSRLDVDSERQLDRLIDPQSLEFWSRRADDRLNSTRVWLYVWRALLAALPPALIGGLRAGPLVFLYAWAGWFLGIQALLWAALGLRVAKQRTLRWVHYWRSARADGLLVATALLLAGAGAWWQGTGFDVPVRISGWFLIVFGLGVRRAVPLIAAGFAWLFPWPLAWMPLAPTLAPYATVLGTVLMDRLVAHVGRIDIERVHQSGWHGCWALLPPLLACLVAGVR